MNRGWGLALLILLLSIGACAPAPLPTPVPTQPLIGPTPTAILADSTASPSTEATEETLSSESNLAIPANAQPVLALVLEDLSARLDVPAADLVLSSLEVVTWTTGGLGCQTVPSGAANADIPGFRMIIQVAGTDYEYHTDTRDHVQLCLQNGQSATRPAPAGADADTDPIAADMVALAQRRLAEDLDLPTSRMRLVELTAMTWPDTSLGCPQPDATYRQQPVDGYRIVLSAGDDEYIFHADFNGLIPCDASDEQLPGEATPETAVSD